MGGEKRYVGGLEKRNAALRDENERLKADKRELVEALERFLAYGDVYRYRQWESSPFEQGQAAVAKHKKE